VFQYITRKINFQIFSIFLLQNSSNFDKNADIENRGRKRPAKDRQTDNRIMIGFD
jgi:hypothetical protein